MKHYLHKFPLDSDRLRLFFMGNTHVTPDVGLASSRALESGVTA